jgi:hypothetical protein
MGSLQSHALEYLAASGAMPISVTERDGVCSIHAGKIHRNRRGPDGGSMRGWPRAWPEKPADSLATAGPISGHAALHRAAASLKATLTPDDVAIARADDAATRLDSMLYGMRRNG